MDCPAGFSAIFAFQCIRVSPPKPGGRSRMTEHTNPYETCYYLWVTRGV